MKNSLKYTSKALQILKYNADSIAIKSFELPQIKENQLLIRIYYVPLIHYDLMTITGVSNKPLPYIPCVELSGIVEDASNKSLIGKKVSFLSLTEGTLKSRMIVNENKALILNDKFDLIKGSVMYCNPFTALGVVDTAIKLKAKSFAITCGNSNVGIQINKIAEDKGLKCISIVRSEKRAEEINKLWE